MLLITQKCNKHMYKFNKNPFLGELKSHTTTHTGERSHTCDQCGSTFTKRSSLEQHKLRHAGVKPHQCDTCPMK